MRWRCFWHYQEVNLTLNTFRIYPYRFQEFARNRLCRKNPEDLYDIVAVKMYMSGAGSEYQQKEFEDFLEALDLQEYRLFLNEQRFV